MTSEPLSIDPATLQAYADGPLSEAITLLEQAEFTASGTSADASVYPDYASGVAPTHDQLATQTNDAMAAVFEQLEQVLRRIRVTIEAYVQHEQAGVVATETIDV